VDANPDVMPHNTIEKVLLSIKNARKLMAIQSPADVPVGYV
jgi:hypothetical protein